MKRLLAISALALMTTAPSTAAQTAAAPSKVTVFVTSAGAINGMTDPSKENKDTVKDLIKQLRDEKELRVVDKREESAIVLIVQDRIKHQITAGLFGDPARDVTLNVKFVYGEMETDMTASAQGGTLGSGGAWGRAAGKIAKQVNAWVKENRQNMK